MRERRRLALVARQAVLAQLARREAMGALAHALGEQARTEALSRRSRDLLREAAGRSPAVDGASLRERAAFARSLASLAEQADRARLDASDQAQWQVATLAAAETRAERIEERRSAANRALAAALERREQQHGAQVAHKLHGIGNEHVDSAPAHRSRRPK